jgi:hypothetical protein
MPFGWSRPHHQTNANQSQFPGNLNLLGCTKGAPLDKSGGKGQLEIRSESGNRTYVITARRMISGLVLK